MITQFVPILCVCGKEVGKNQSRQVDEGESGSTKLLYYEWVFIVLDVGECITSGDGDHTSPNRTIEQRLLICF